MVLPVNRSRSVPLRSATRRRHGSCLDQQEAATAKNRSNAMNGDTIKSCENAFLLRKRASRVVLSGPSDAVETKSHGRNDPGPSGAGSSPLLSNGGCAFVRTDNAAGARRPQPVLDTAPAPDPIGAALGGQPPLARHEIDVRKHFAECKSHPVGIERPSEQHGHELGCRLGRLSTGFINGATAPLVVLPQLLDTPMQPVKGQVVSGQHQTVAWKLRP